MCRRERSAGFEQVIYSVSSAEIAEFTGSEPSVRSQEMLDGINDVAGPVRNEEGRQVHAAFDW